MVESYCSKVTGEHPITLLKYCPATGVCLRIYSGTTKKPTSVFFLIKVRFSTKRSAIFFLSKFPFTDTDDSQWRLGKGGDVLYSSSNIQTFICNFIHLKWLSHTFWVCSTGNFLSPVFSPYLWSLEPVTSGVSGASSKKNSTTFCLLTLFGFFIVFHMFCFAKVVFIIFISFLIKHQISATEYLPIRNQNCLWELAFDWFLREC